MLAVHNLISTFLSLKLRDRLLYALTAILVTIYFISVSVKGGDFASYLEASGKMLHGTDIYAPPHIHLRYSYSPFWAMVLMPLALLPMRVGVLIWLVLNIFFLWRTVFLIRNFFEIKFENRRLDTILWATILLFLSRFIELNFHHAQMTMFLLWSILESMKFIYQENEGKAGVLIGLSIIIKVMPVVLVPYLIYRRAFKTTLTALSTVLITFFLPIIIVGNKMFWSLNNTWYNILRPNNSDFLADNVDYFPQNLSALLYRIFTKTDAPYIHNLFSFSYQQATDLIWAIIVLMIFCTIYFLNGYPFKSAKSKIHTFYELSYISLVIPLIFPHQMKYAFYFLLPCVASLVFTMIKRWQQGDIAISFYFSILCIVTAFLLCTATTDLLLGVHYSVITQYLKTITIGTLILIIPLATNKRYFLGES